MKRTFLERDNAAYELLACRVPHPQGVGGPEATLGFVEGLAGVAWHAHPGKYADGKIENVLLRVGESLDSYLETITLAADWQPPTLPSTEGRHLLHVATEVKAIGGHTRLLKNWIQSDATSTHSVVLTAQYNPIPTWFRGAVIERGGGLIVMPPDAPRLCKAKWLRLIAKGFDAVILHHHPSDVVPTVALAVADLPPVAVMNHADHVFWLGSAVTDLVINIRPAGELLSAARRMVGRNELLPIPLGVGSVTCTRTDARQKLGIHSDQIMILTVGSASKYTPIATHNFYATAQAILDQHRTAQLYMVGVDPDQAEPYGASRYPRLHCVGKVEDPSPYYAAADLYLEGFPFGSLTALLQAASEGLSVVLPYGIESPVLATDDIAVAEVPRPRDEAEYLEQVATLIFDPERRVALGQALQERVLGLHTGIGWQQILHEIYAELDEMRHEPRLLPTGDFTPTLDDLALSKLHATYDDVPQFGFLNRHASELNVGVLARLFFTLPAVRSGRPVYKYYGRWARVMWRRLTSMPAGQRPRREASH